MGDEPMDNGQMNDMPMPDMENDSMGGEPNMGDEPMNDDSMGDEPNMSDDSMNDEPMGDEPNMGDEPMDYPENDDNDDSTISIINQLSKEDKEAVRAYAESMLKRSEPSSEDNQPMMETFIFSKKQLQTIMENFNDTNNREERNTLNKKEKRTVSKKSPFNSPKFN